MKTATIDDQTGDLMTVKEFKEMCDSGGLIDYDGMGDLIKNGKIVTSYNPSDSIWPDWIKPSARDTIPEDVTHILWYNK